MTNCIKEEMCFTALSGKKVLADFSGGSVSSNAGVLILRELDRKLNLSKRLAALIPDSRTPQLVQHSIRSMISQRLFALALGYEDLNDHNHLRQDECLKTASGSLSDLASSSTLCRFENGIDRETIGKMNGLLLDVFIEHHQGKPPKEMVIDFDSTDFLSHGDQEQSFYNGYYEHDCFMPLYAFCGNQLLSVLLRPSNVDGAHQAWGLFAVLYKRIKAIWPNTNIIFRGDGGFCRDKMLRWCDRKGIDYIVGMAKNNWLMIAAKSAISKAKHEYEATGEVSRTYAKFEYAAESWRNKRTLVARVECNRHGENVRFIATNLKGHSPTLYEGIYCQRGDMENRIKQQKLDLKADRVSCHRFVANQFRVVLSGFAYVLLSHLKLTYLKRSKLKNAYVGTIRNQLLKIGAVIIKNTRKIKILMDSHFPEQVLFISIIRKLHPA